MRGWGRKSVRHQFDPHFRILSADYGLVHYGCPEAAEFESPLPVKFKMAAGA